DQMLRAERVAEVPVLRPRDQGHGAAAHAVEQRDHLRHRGHLHAAAAGMPMAVPIARPTTMRPHLWMPGRSRVSTTAIAMPTAATQLPRRAVLGEVMKCSPMMK